MKTKKIAIVCDWLTNMGGAERVVYAMHKAFPDAPIYTSVFEPDQMPLFKDLDIRTTWLQNLPKFIRRRHQLYAPLRALAFRQLKLQGYDIIISSASAEAKAIKKPKGSIHFCYCHTPIRYYWSHYDQYKKDPGFGILNPLIKLITPPFVAWMKKLDSSSAQKVDHFIANSNEVKKRIQKYYKRNSTVVFPPVEVNRLKPSRSIKKENYFLCVGRQIPYKRFDLAIKACNELGKKLIIIGNGSEHQKLKEIAGPTIEFKQANDREIVKYFQQAKGFIFPTEEDFGITPIEAMAAGTPVVAFGKGGAQDYMQDKITGVIFNDQTVKSLSQAIKKFENINFDNKKIINHASKFDENRFIIELKKSITSRSN